MSGRIGILSVVLALQLVIIAVVLFTESGFGKREAGPFLDFDVSKVSAIKITGGDDHADTLVLSRSDDGWQLPSGLPADGNKVDDVLGKLAGLKSPWPVATSSSAADRFEVTDDHFQRHVVLLAGDDVAAELYLGTSPGYQQVHARRAGDDSVYSVAISNYQVPAAADDWLDKALLDPKGDVTAVEREGGWKLRHGDEGWLLGDAAADQKAADDLIQRLTELRVTGTAQAPAAGVEPSAVLAVTDSKGTYRLRLIKDDKGDDYRIGSDRRDGWFAVAGFTADKLLPEQKALLPDKEAPDHPGDQPKPADARAGKAPAPAPTHREPG